MTKQFVFNHNHSIFMFDGITFMCGHREHNSRNRWLDTNRNELGKLNSSWAEAFYFMIYLVLVFGVFIYLLLRILD